MALNHGLPKCGCAHNGPLLGRLSHLIRPQAQQRKKVHVILWKRRMRQGFLYKIELYQCDRLNHFELWHIRQRMYQPLHLWLNQFRSSFIIMNHQFMSRQTKVHSKIQLLVEARLAATAQSHCFLYDYQSLTSLGSHLGSLFFIMLLHFIEVCTNLFMQNSRPHDFY